MPASEPISFLDAGSNIGLATSMFARALAGLGQVVTVEANPETFKVWCTVHMTLLILLQ